MVNQIEELKDTMHKLKSLYETNLQLYCDKCVEVEELKDNIRKIYMDTDQIYKKNNKLMEENEKLTESLNACILQNKTFVEGIRKEIQGD